MIARGRTELSRITLHRGEYGVLFNLRRETLDQVAREATLEGHVPARERVGYRGSVKLLSRDAQGNLAALITVTAPHLSKGYRRGVRLIKRKPLRLVEG